MKADAQRGRDEAEPQTTLWAVIQKWSVSFFIWWLTSQIINRCWFMPNPKLNTDISVHFHQKSNKNIWLHLHSLNDMQENANADLTRLFQLFTRLK